MNKVQTTILSVISIAGLLAIGALFGGYLPKTEQELGSAITTIQGTDRLTDTRSVLNTMFSNLNNDKWENGRESIVFGSLTATSTTATSTISWGLAAIQRLGIGSTATTTILGNNSTSTFSGGIQSSSLDITSTSATSTFANGIRIIGGTLQLDKTINCEGTVVLTSDGTGKVKCGTPTMTPGGSDTQVQFNDGGLLAGDADYVWNKTTNALTVTSATASSSFSGGLSALGLQASSLTSSGALSLFATGANSILFQTNGSERGVLTSGGNLGLGTTTPGLLLSVAGNGLFGGSTGTTTIEHGANLATKGGNVNIGTSSPFINTFGGSDLFVDGSAATATCYPATGATITVDWGKCNKARVTLSQAGTTVNFQGGTPGQVVTFTAVQDSTGNRTITTFGSGIFFFTSSPTNGTTSPGMTTKAFTANKMSCEIQPSTTTPATVLQYECSLFNGAKQ